MYDKLNELDEQLKKGKPNFPDFKEFFDTLMKIQREFQSKLEYAAEMKKDQREFENLYKTVAGINASDLVDKLTKLGYRLKNELGDAFGNMGYRLLEQTRAGKRDGVYYGILRIFVSQNKKFPDQLVEAFKPIYSDEMFKVFIFSFLSGIIGNETKNEI